MDKIRFHAPFVVAAIATCTVLLVLVGKPIPIVIWDEGRIIVSAMEMRHSGLGLVSTYGNHQDLWNTKPPLLIWMMTASMALLGPTEFALRLPSLISSIGTILLVMFFLRQITCSVPIAAFGGLSLAASVGFFGEHGARTGDYDALLCFFTTGYLMLLFFSLHRQRPARHWLYLAGVLGAGALMSKSVAGGVPIAGFLLYILVIGRWRRLFATHRYVVAALIAITPILLFLVLREYAARGYLNAMIYNDVTGRFSESLGDHSGSIWYYFDTTFARGLFSLGGGALLAPLALPVSHGKTRLALIFALCIATGQLAVITTSSTKLAHYYLPAYPFVAIAAALAVHASLTRLRTASIAGALSPRMYRIACFAPALLLMFGVVQAVEAQKTVLTSREYYPGARYGVLLDALVEERAPILLIERGWKVPGDPHYAPELRFYAMVAREKGRRVDQTGDVSRITSVSPGTIVASCDPSLTPLLHRYVAKPLLELDGCVASRKSKVSPPQVSASRALYPQSS